MIRSRIIGTGSYLPERVVTNDQLASEMKIDTTDAWIRERTGIGARRIAAAGEATSDMATKAGREACALAGIQPEQLDLIIVGTVTPDMPFPAAAALVQHKLGATRAAAFDVSAACAGSIYSLSIADQYIRTGTAKHVLIVGAELLTRIVDWTDRSTCVLFGDAAGAMVLGPDSRGPDRGVLSTQLRTDGSLANILCIPGGGTAKPFSQAVLDGREHLVHMNGREVFKFAVRALEALARDTLAKAGMTTSDLQHVCAHQANMRIIEAVMERLEIPLSKCHLNIERVGNTSSASVPLSLDQANRAGSLREGDSILMMAIGGGMSWGSAVVRW